jgi:DNA-binding beta-propeller fold protein YncE
MGNMYVADRENHRILFFPVGQTNGIIIAGITGISGANSTLLNRPFSVAFDSQLNLYVADAFNSRVQKFVRY